MGDSSGQEEGVVEREDNCGLQQSYLQLPASENIKFEEMLSLSGKPLRLLRLMSSQAGYLSKHSLATLAVYATASRSQADAPTQ